jgi:hypothetical protein
MRLSISWSDSRFVSGLVMLAVGAFVLVESGNYSRGSLLRMGPGYFPTMLGAILLMIGALMLVASFFARAETIVRPDVRALACIGLGLALFAFIVPRFGLAPALALLVPTTASASPLSRPIPVLVLTCVLIGFAWLIFIELLSLPVPLMSW